MARINSNVASLVARSNLSKTNSDLQVRLVRLATGLRINKGADDPAGLIVSQRLRSEVSGLQQAINNSDRASSVIATTESALSEVNGLLNSLKALVVEAANTGAVSDEERTANQLQIDSAIDSITRISNSASFGGLKLLNGELDYVLSGMASSAVTKAQIFGANFAGQKNVKVDVQTVASAQTGRLFLRGDYSNTAYNGTFQSSVTLEVSGSRGVQVIEILSGRPLSEVVAAVNSFREVTGVSASLLNAGNLSSGLSFSTIDYGSSEFVSVKRLNGPTDGGFFKTFQIANNQSVPGAFSFANGAHAALLAASNRDAGRDVFAIVNGALTTGKGIKLSSQNSSSLSFDLLLSKDFATINGSSTTFRITGGGALYQLGGDINTTQQINIGFQSVAASKLGGTLIGSSVDFLSSIKSGGANDLATRNFTNASSILQTAIDEISVLRGRLGALERNTLDTNARSLQTAIENLTASESRIADADFAAETSALTRAQVLSSTGTSVLTLANQQSQQVLRLLGG
ncbi:MAG: flagellin [Phycisphaerae bacterium]|nr:flagellin [Phycisphaerae bacterium]